MPGYPGLAPGRWPGLEVVAWDGGGDPPPEAATAAMWVAPFGPHDQAAAVARMPELRVVQLLTAGRDHVGPLPGVILCTAAGVHDGAVAEWAMAVILAQLRSLPAWLADQPRGERTHWESGTLQGTRVVIVGHGGIGRALARRLDGFEAEVVPVASRARPGVRGVAELDGLLEDAEVLVLAVPLTDETRGLLGRARLAALPDGALVINLARGEVLDQEALAAELARGRLRAALDVSVPDPLPPGDPLRTAPGLLYTPHVAAATTRMFPALAQLVLAQLRRLQAGEPLVNVVGGPADDR
jgi:phosphoglycerate dehydrogenase-like enzyme